MNEAVIANDLSMFLRVLVIVVLAGVIGWEREAAGKAAGLRTYILVGISSVLFILAGEFMVLKFQNYSSLVRFDLVGLVGAVVTGISFLGAGMIVFRKGENTVQGLTTAAGILTTAAIGMIVGLERYVLAIGTTIIVFFVLRFLNMIEKRYIDDEKDKPAADEAGGPNRD